MAEGDFQNGDFVSFEKNAAGEVTAIHSNMAKINLLSTRILDRVPGLKFTFDRSTFFSTSFTKLLIFKWKRSLCIFLRMGE